jgi:hypothetical protein
VKLRVNIKTLHRTPDVRFLANNRDFDPFSGDTRRNTLPIRMRLPAVGEIPQKTSML